MCSALSLRREVVDLTPWIIETRRQIHANPELKYEEYQTSALAENTFRKLGFELKTGLATTGVAAIWDSGRPGPVIGLRADMDALVINEITNLEFASRKPGLMHACGHDAHMAMLLGTARALAKSGHKWPIRGQVLFICQPAEEGGFGARQMLDDGLYQWCAPQAVFAAHVDPDRPVGSIIISRGLTAMAGAIDFNIKIIGRGGHAAMPELSDNPLVGIAAVLEALFNAPQPAEAVFTPTVIRTSVRTNTIPNEAEVAGTLRYLSPEGRKKAQAILEQAAGQGGAGPLKSFLQLELGPPPVLNNPAMANLVRQTATTFLGPNNVIAGEPAFSSEDLAYFLNVTPGALFWLGAADEEGSHSPLHSPTFILDERALPLGVEFWLRLVEALSAQSDLDELQAKV